MSRQSRASRRVLVRFALTALPASFACVAALACFDRSGVDLGLGARADGGASVDAVPDAGPCFPIAVSNFDPCALPAPLGAVDLADGAWVLDTDDGTLTDGTVAVPVATEIIAQQGGPEILVVVADGFSIAAGAEIDVVGLRAAALVSHASLVVEGVIDATGARGVRGPGAGDFEACEQSFGERGVSMIDMVGRPGGSGGGGGGFAGPGGAGGALSNATGDTAAGGAAGGSPALVPLRGGCGGGFGGSNGGAGGFAGGAIQLVAAEDIQIAGAVSASGGPGGGAGLNSPFAGGGGGGGSGGGLLVEARRIAIRGALTANGGGAGQGRGPGDRGASGEDGSDESAVPAAGGDDPDGGGIGGAGGARGAAATDGQQAEVPLPASAGGGGGGGSAGRIHLRAYEPLWLEATAVISPDAE